MPHDNQAILSALLIICDLKKTEYSLYHVISDFHRKEFIIDLPDQIDEINAVVESLEKTTFPDNDKNYFDFLYN